MLRFGTAGLRGPLREGPDGMNVTTVSRATAGLADWLRERCLGGGAVVVGRDARHGSAEFATATAEIFTAAGFPVTVLPDPVPTPVVAFAVRELGATAAKRARRPTGSTCSVVWSPSSPRSSSPRWPTPS